MPRLETVWLAMERASRRAALKAEEAAAARSRESVIWRSMAARFSLILRRRSAAASAMAAAGAARRWRSGVAGGASSSNFLVGGKKKKKTRHHPCSVVPSRARRKTDRIRRLLGWAFLDWAWRPNRPKGKDWAPRLLPYACIWAQSSSRKEGELVGNKSKKTLLKKLSPLYILLFIDH